MRMAKRRQRSSTTPSARNTIRHLSRPRLRCTAPRRASLVAPFAGTVAAVNITAGGVAGTGTAVTLADLSALHVDVNVSETELPKLKLGQPASISFEALPDVVLNGVVESIAPTPTSG